MQGCTTNKGNKKEEILVPKPTIKLSWVEIENVSIEKLCVFSKTDSNRSNNQVIFN